MTSARKVPSRPRAAARPSADDTARATAASGTAFLKARAGARRQRLDRARMIVDHLLDKGGVLDAEVVVGFAGVDLVYVRLAALLCAADRTTGRSVPE